MLIEYLIFDPAACGFPRPRISPLPFGLAGLSLKAQASQVWAPVDNFHHFALGRYALREAYRLAGVGCGTALLAPAYHCRTMIDPVFALGGDVVLYPLRQDLAPDLTVLDSLLARSPTPVKALLATHFFGFPQPFDELAVWCAERSIALVEDCSHVLFCERFRPPGTALHSDFVASSPYKFFPSPDGGLLYARQPQLLDGLQERPPTMRAELHGIRRAISQAKHYRRAARNCDSTSIDADLAALAERPTTPGNDSRRSETCSADYRRAAEGLAPLRFSRLVWRHADIDEISRRRRRNYRRWVDALADSAHCRPLYPELPDGCIPYMLPLYINHPDTHFYQLKHLGVPVWRWDSIAASSCPTANDYRLHLLHLPCHQSLSEDQLDWMIAAIQQVGVSEGKSRGAGGMTGAR